MGTDHLVAGLLALAFVCEGLEAPRAHAQDNAALADSLFQEARELAIKQNRWADACPKFAESHRLKPGGGVVLNLALCYRKIGRIASAHARYREGLAIAEREGNAERLKVAREAIAELEPLLSHLTILVPPASALPGLVVRLDDEPLAAASYGVRIAIDPGTLVVRASAPDHVGFEQKITIGESADARTVEIPALAPVVVATPKPPPTDPTPPPKPPPIVDERASPGSAQGSARRPIGYVVGAVGLVGLGVGSYFGVRALQSKHASDDACVGGCTQRGADQSRDAVRFGNFATVGVGVGVAALGVGAWLLFTGGEPTAHARTVPVLSVAKDEVGVAVVGRF